MIKNHNAISRIKSCFKLTLKTLESLEEKAIKLCLNILVVKQNPLNIKMHKILLKNSFVKNK